jgi:hypothetical protein
MISARITCLFRKRTAQQTIVEWPERIIRYVFRLCADSMLTGGVAPKRGISLYFLTDRHRRIAGLPWPNRGIRLLSQIAEPLF